LNAVVLLVDYPVRVDDRRQRHIDRDRPPRRQKAVDHVDAGDQQRSAVLVRRVHRGREKPPPRVVPLDRVDDTVQHLLRRIVWRLRHPMDVAH